MKNMLRKSLHIKMRQEFTLGDRLIAKCRHKCCGCFLSQVIEGEAIILPKPHLWDAQPMVYFKTIKPATGNHHFNGNSVVVDNRDSR